MNDKSVSHDSLALVAVLMGGMLLAAAFRVANEIQVIAAQHQNNPMYLVFGAAVGGGIFSLGLGWFLVRMWRSLRALVSRVVGAAL